MRTSVGTATKLNGKWNISFETFAGKPGKEYLAGVVTTPAKFETEDAAYAAGQRAMNVLEQTGLFPNFSEAF